MGKPSHELELVALQTSPPTSFRIWYSWSSWDRQILSDTMPHRRYRNEFVPALGFSNRIEQRFVVVSGAVWSCMLVMYMTVIGRGKMSKNWERMFGLAKRYQMRRDPISSHCWAGVCDASPKASS